MQFASHLCIHVLSLSKSNHARRAAELPAPFMRHHAAQRPEAASPAGGRSLRAPHDDSPRCCISAIQPTINIEMAPNQSKKRGSYDPHRLGALSHTPRAALRVSATETTTNRMVPQTFSSPWCRTCDVHRAATAYPTAEQCAHGSLLHVSTGSQPASKKTTVHSNRSQTSLCPVPTVTATHRLHSGSHQVRTEVGACSHTRTAPRCTAAQPHPFQARIEYPGVERIR